MSILPNHKDAIERFEVFRRTDSPDWLLAFYGMSGVGKTLLVDTLLKQTQEGRASTSILLNFESTLRDNYTDTLATFEKLLRPGIADEAWNVYESQKAKAITQVENEKVRARNYEFSQVQNAEGGGSVEGNQSATINIYESNIASDGATLIAPKLAEAAEFYNGLPLIVLIDHWHLLLNSDSKDFRKWLTQDMLLALHNASPQFRVVITSDRIFNEQNLTSGVVNMAILALEEAEAIEWMKAEDVRQESLRSAIWEATEGNPALMQIAITICKENPTIGPSDFVTAQNEQAATTWLARIIEHSSKTSARAIERGVILQKWVVESLEAACQRDDDPQENPIIFDFEWRNHFIQSSIISQKTAPYEFASIVRKTQIRQLWIHQPKSLREGHKRAMEWWDRFGNRLK